MVIYAVSGCFLLFCSKTVPSLFQVPLMPPYRSQQEPIIL
jgi:hypothetical protein